VLSQGAECCGVDCDSKPLAGGNDPQKTRFRIGKEVDPIHVNVLPDLQAHAEVMQAGGSFLPHHGWIIQVAGNPGDVRFRSVMREDGPRVILEKQRDPGKKSNL